jgi:hypothetical protein
MACAPLALIGCIDWIDGEDEDDDENAREGFNDTFESDGETDDED